MKPIRILLVISTKGWGGTEAYASLLAKGIAEKGNSVWVATPKPGEAAKTVSKSSLIYINSSPLFFSWTLLKMIFYVFYHRIQIIHGNSGKDYWLVFLTGLLTFRKVVLTRHLMTPFSKHTRRMVLFSKTKVIAPAQVTFDVLENSGLREKNLVRIYNGIDPSPFMTPHGKFRSLYKLPADAFITGIVSNIHHPRGKGHFTIIQSIPEILQCVPKAFWMIGGGGPLLPDLIQQAKDLKIDDRIVFTGNLLPNQVPHFLASLDLFILLSYDREGGCPLSIMEAMATGLPVIASHIGGNKEIVEDDKTGYLINPEDKNNLIKNSIYLFENPEKRKKMGEEGKKKIIEFFNYKRMTEETIQVYRNTLDESS
ncbi:MAG: glycosyltransferase family 4 protein [Nitrospiria bacterium]